MAKENINMPIEDCRVPAIALKQCFRWIEVPKQGKRSKLSLFFLP
jgi:hypothetical protein